MSASESTGPSHTSVPLRKMLLERQPLIGSWIQISDAASAELLAEAGFQWICVDLEHFGIDIPQFMQIIRGLHGRGTAPLARVRENDTLAIRQALDVGAAGVVVPLVHTADEARRAVEAAKYPPQGKRGFCYSRMNDWGQRFTEYAAAANNETAVIVMAESRSAVENIDAILAVDGVDAVFIGPYDLSGSYGIPGQIQHPLVQDGCAKILEACHRAGKAAGLHIVIPDPKVITETLQAGYTFLALGADIVFLREAAREAFTVALAVEKTSECEK